MPDEAMLFCEIIIVQGLALCFEIQKLRYKNTDMEKEMG